MSSMGLRFLRTRHRPGIVPANRLRISQLVESSIDCFVNGLLNIH
jgi:hypothetical protein